MSAAIKNGVRKKKTRRARGSGSIFFSKPRGLWVGRVPCGHTKGGYTRYRELSDPDQRRLVERLKKVLPPGPDTTVAEWAERWLAESSARPSTLSTYSYTVRNWINPTLGNIRAASLTPQHVQAALRQWTARLKPSVARLYLIQLRTMLNAARRAGIIQSNPASEVRSPKAIRRKIDPLEPAELARVVAAALKLPGAEPIAVLAATGCRVGECLALNVVDWDPNRGTINISKTWTRAHGIGPPKSERSIRKIRIPESARPAVERAARGRHHGPLFAAGDGQTRRGPESIRAAFDTILKRLRVPRRNLHQLRHSVGSNLIDAGASLADTAEFLGDSVEVVVATYLHPVQRDPSRDMDRMLSGGKVSAAAKRTRKLG